MHVVFSVKGRENILPAKKRPEIFKYISGILTNIDQYSLAVNGYKDHVHIFFEMQPTKFLSDIVRIAKANSSKCPPDRTGRDKRKEYRSGQLFMAGRIWWIFIFPFPKE